MQNWEIKIKFTEIELKLLLLIKTDLIFQALSEIKEFLVKFRKNRYINVSSKKYS